MNEEIKEILEDVKRHLDYVEATKQASIRDNEMKAMYYYITNLQEELKEANESLTWWTNRFNAVERDNRELKQENKKLKETNEEHRKINGDLRKENQKLVKVIDELEKWLKEDEEKAANTWEMGRCFNMFDILNKLTELKGGSDDVKN